MKKEIILIIFFLGMMVSNYAQVAKPCEEFQIFGLESTEAYFEDLKKALEINLPKLKQTRQWARKNNKPQVELATNRLEYWAKKFNQFIHQNKESNLDAVCEKFEKEREYISDFVQLTVMFYLTNGLNWNKVDYTKYK